MYITPIFDEGESLHMTVVSLAISVSGHRDHVRSQERHQSLDTAWCWDCVTSDSADLWRGVRCDGKRAFGTILHLLWQHEQLKQCNDTNFYFNFYRILAIFEIASPIGDVTQLLLCLCFVFVWLCQGPPELVLLVPAWPVWRRRLSRLTLTTLSWCLVSE